MGMATIDGLFYAAAWVLVGGVVALGVCWVAIRTNGKDDRP